MSTIVLAFSAGRANKEARAAAGLLLIYDLSTTVFHNHNCAAVRDALGQGWRHLDVALVEHPAIAHCNGLISRSLRYLTVSGSWARISQDIVQGQHEEGAFRCISTPACLPGVTVTDTNSLHPWGVRRMTAHFRCRRVVSPFFTDVTVTFSPFSRAVTSPKTTTVSFN